MAADATCCHAVSHWTTYPLLRESFNGSLRLSYIVRVEGCSGYSSVQRLVLTTAMGATYSQGLGECTSTFMEQVGCHAASLVRCCVPCWE